MPVSELIDSTRRAARVGMATQVAVQIMSIAGTVVLARILAPRDFGILALATSIAGFLSLFASVGVGANLLRRKSGVEDAASTYYWILLTASVVLIAVLLLVGPAMARLLGQSGAAEAVRVFAFCLPPALLLTVVQSILRWHLNWGRYNLTIWLPAMCLVVLEIALAVAGLGYWAVVIATVVSSWVGLLLAHAVAKWIPAPTFRISHIRRDLGMSGSLWSQQFLVFVQRNADYWAVSRYMGAAPLGMYYVAFVLPSVVRQRVTSVSQSTLLAVLSRCSDDPDTFRRIWARSVVLQLFVGAPALIGLAAVSEPVIDLFFGRQWGAAAAVVPWICIAGLIEIYVAATAMAAVALGLARRSLIVALFRTAMVVVGAFLAAGLTGRLTVVAASVMIGTLGGAVAQDLLLAHRLRLGWRLIGKDLLRVAVTTSVMYGGVRAVVQLIGDGSSPAVVLAVAVPAGVLIYAVVAYFVANDTAKWTLRQLRLAVRPARSSTAERQRVTGSSGRDRDL